MTTPNSDDDRTLTKAAIKVVVVERVDEMLTAAIKIVKKRNAELVEAGMVGGSHAGRSVLVAAVLKAISDQTIHFLNDE